MKKIKSAFLKLGLLFRRVFKRKQKVFQVFKRHRWLLIFPVLGFLVIIYFLSAFFLISPARLKLSEFQKSVNADGPCHEDCLLARKQLKDELAAYFKRDKKFQKDVENLFLAERANEDPEASLNFKKELLEIMASANGANNPPEFIADYFLSANVKPELKAEIIKLFLASSVDPGLTDYYFSLLDSRETTAVKTEAVRALSSLPNKSAYFKVEEIARLETLILQSKAPLSLKADFIFLLTDFYDFFPVETELALSAVYENSSQNIVKAFAADTLNNLGFKEFEAPSVSAADWTEYYNN